MLRNARCETFSVIRISHSDPGDDGDLISPPRPLYDTDSNALQFSRLNGRLQFVAPEGAADAIHLQRDLVSMDAGRTINGQDQCEIYNGACGGDGICCHYDSEAVHEARPVTVERSRDLAFLHPNRVTLNRSQCLPGHRDMC